MEKSGSPSKVFYHIAEAFQGDYAIICNEGGSRSGKTYSTVHLLIQYAVRVKNKRISLVSHSLPHIKRGALRDFRQLMENFGYWDEARWSATNFTYTFKNGSYIELFGLEDEGKARGPGRDILFVNEANLIKKSLFDQLAMRTTGKIFLDWNPADFNSWVYDLADNPKNLCIHSTYLDNIHNLSQTQIDYIEGYKNLPDDFLWKVYGLGLRGAAKELIYTTWQRFQDAPEGGDVFYGLDFGYTNPSAMVKVTHYEGANYVEEVLYQSGLTVPEMINRIKSMDIGRKIIYADCAEPKTIEEIYKAGINIKPSDKDVWAGIVGVKSYPLYVKGENLIMELQSYKWKKDKNDNVTEDPVKANDHLCFAGHTRILTDLGLVDIWDIEEGDRVLTSQGYKRVLKTFDNGLKETYLYRIQCGTICISLECTPNHPIKADNEWIPISQLRQGQKVNLLKYLEEEGLSSTETQLTTPTAQPSYIGTFGRKLSGLFRKATTYIIKTVTPITTTLKTLNLFQAQGIVATICGNELSKTPNGIKSFNYPVLKLLQNGTDHQKGLSGISNTQNGKDLETLRTAMLNAKYARQHTPERNPINLSAPTLANQSTEETQDLTILAETVNDAQHLSYPTNTNQDYIVQKVVASPISGLQRVYNLEVEDVHEYYAEGMLVHNCDAMRYAIFTNLVTPKKKLAWA